MGTADLDLVLELALLEEERYQEIATLLRSSHFQPDVKPDTGTVRFLIPPSPRDGDTLEPGQIKKLETDFGAIVLPAAELAFRDRIPIEVTGRNLQGAWDTRTLGVGPAALLILKAFAHRYRDEPKDAYNLDYLVAHFPEAPETILERFSLIADSEHVPAALTILREAFQSLDHTGPRDVTNVPGIPGR